MKIELDLLEDQIEFLEKIRNLPKMVEDYIGILPQSFPYPASYVDIIKQSCEEMEFACRKWILSTAVSTSEHKGIWRDILKRQRYDSEPNLMDDSGE